MGNSVKPPTKTAATRARILEAAAELARELGFDGATTRRIASRAGVNEVTLFRHFPTKEDLFLAIVLERQSAITADALLPDLPGERMEDDLTEFAVEMLNHLTRHGWLIVAAMAEGRRHPERSARIAERPMRIRERLAAYLETAMNQGRLRRTDPQVAAQALMSLIFAHAMMLGDEEGVRLPPPRPDLSNEETVRSYVDLLLNGLRPDGECPE